MTHLEIHQETGRRIKKYKSSHGEVLEMLVLVDEKEVYRKMGYSSLWQYLRVDHQLCETDVGRFLHILKASKKVPEFKEAVTSGSLAFSKAACIASHVTQSNQETWIQKAKNSSVRELEREIIKESPKALPRERIQARTEDVYELKLGIKKETLDEIKRAQDVLSQKLKRPVTMEETLSHMAKLFLEKKDPIEKAVRAKPPTSEVIPQGRVAWPSWIKHKIYKEFQGRCGETLPDGSRCDQRRHLEIHHIVPLSQGGSNHPDNLKLLCWGHHRTKHPEFRV